MINCTGSSRKRKLSSFLEAGEETIEGEINRKVLVPLAAKVPFVFLYNSF